MLKYFKALDGLVSDILEPDPNYMKYGQNIMIQKPLFLNTI